MNSLQNLFQQTQLAEASYANLSGMSVSTSPNVLALALRTGDGSLSEAQAAEFVKHWRVVNQYIAPAGLYGLTDGTGFSATVFESLDTPGQYSLSLRGTQPGYSDLAADLGDILSDGIALDQLVDMYNYWQSLTHVGIYQAKQLNTLATETVELRAAYLISPAAGLAYEAILRTNGNFIIDNPSRTVRTIEPVNSDQLSDPNLQIGTGKLPLTAVVNVDGHSLGGHLAMAFSRLFAGNTNSVTAVNGAGFNFGNSNVDHLFAMLGGAAGFDTSKITNVVGSAAMNLVSQDWLFLQQPAGRNEIYTESYSTDNVVGHGKSQMTDSLALYSLFATIDPTLNTPNPADGIANITTIIKAASPDKLKSLELTLDALRTLFQQNYQYGQLEYAAVPTLVGDSATARNAYYVNLQSLQTWLKDNPISGLSIQPLADVNGSQIASLALADTAEGMAYRYALYKLNPFVVTGSTALYDGINAHNELKLYTPDSNTGRFTEQYLKDRAAMLSWKLGFGTRDTEPVGDTFVKPQGGTPFYFEDFTSNAITTKMRIGGGDSVNAVMSRPLGDFKLVVFGSENDDVLTGQGKDDRLYGGTGDDTLKGNGGSDYLEGGAGYDTYLFNPGDGYDTVLDSDGLGVIEIGGVKAYGSATAGLDLRKWIKLSDYGYVDTQNSITYHLSIVDGETRLLIHKGDTNVLVKGWSGNELGIALGEGSRPPVPSTEGSIFSISPKWVAGVDTGGLVIEGGRAGDTLEGGAGADRIWGGADPNRYYGSAAEYEEYSEDADDLIVGGSGSDALMGGFGNDLIYAESQISIDDAIVLGNVQTGTGLLGDWLSGGVGQDTLIGSAGNDILFGGVGHEGDLIVAGAGDDLILGGYGESPSPGAYTGLPPGHEWWISYLPSEGLAIYTSGTFDMKGLMDGLASADIFGYTKYGLPIPNSGTDIVYAGNGMDFVQGSFGDDILMGEGGGDFIWGQFGDDVILGGEGADHLWGDGFNEHMAGGIIDTDHYSAFSSGWVSETYVAIWAPMLNGADYIDGGAGDDLITGGGGDDYLLGGPDNDWLYGDGNGTLPEDEGDDTLDGGTGADYMAGGGGNDTYLNVTGDDTLFDNQGHNTVELAASAIGADGLAASEETDASGQEYMQLQIALDTGGALKIDDPFAASGTTTLRFANGDEFDLETLVGEQLFTPLNLQLGNSGGRVYGGAENDTLTGGTGDDTLVGQNGDDWLRGNAGADVLIGGDGDDSLHGGDGADVLEGGWGDDYLEGGEGADIYRFEREDGNDIIDDASGRIEFGEGVDLQDFRIVQIAHGYRTYYSPEGDSVDVPHSWADGSNPLVFADGSYVLSNQLFSGLPVLVMEGGRYQDVLVSTRAGLRFEGGRGDDVLLGGAGDNAYVFNWSDGDDAIVDLGGVDTIIFGYGITPDDVWFEYRDAEDGLPAFRINVSDWGGSLAIKDGEQGVIEQFVFDDGTQLSFAELAMLHGWSSPMVTAADGMYLYQDNALVLGTPGNDTLEDDDVGEVVYAPGPGNDQLEIYAGDTYFYVLNEGDGHDTLYHESATRNETLVFGSGITESSVRIEVASGRYTIHYGSLGDTLVIPRGPFLDRILFADGSEVRLNKHASFADGTYDLRHFAAEAGEVFVGIGPGGIAPGPFDIPALTHAQPSVHWTGTDAADTYIARDMLAIDGAPPLPQQDVVDGGAGDDAISTLSGNDWLAGGTGNDLLQGGKGSDVYYFKAGDGQDVIREARNPGDRNYLRIQIPGLTGWGGAAFGYDAEADTLTVRYGLEGDTIRVENFYPTGLDEDAAISGVSVTDETLHYGGDYTLDDIKAAVHIIGGTPGDDTLTGSDANDFLFGNAGADILQGGNGDDILRGGAGDDTYVINLGDGVDTIIDDFAEGETNTIVFGEGVDPAAIRLFKGSLGLDLGGGNSVHIEGVDYDDLANTSSITRFVFSNGTVLSLEQLLERGLDIEGGAVDDTLLGTSAVDRIHSGTGNDTLDGGAGADIYLFNRGDGVDTIVDTGNDEANFIRFGPGIASSDIERVWEGATLVLNYGEGDAVRIPDFYRGADESSPVVQTILFDDGKTEPAVGQVNHAPVVSTPISDWNAYVGRMMQLAIPSGVFSDPDAGDTLTYSATLADGSALPSWLTFTTYGNSMSVFYGVPATTGTISVRVTAVDGGSLSVSDVFDIHVASTPPLILNGTSGADTLNGAAGDDILNGLAGNDVIHGYGGNDTITGGAGNDSLFGDGGNDLFLVAGDSGSDTVNGGEGFDEIRGSDGDDIFRFANYTGDNRVERIDGGAGYNRIVSGVNQGRMDFSTTELVNIARIEGGAGSDQIRGSTGNDVIAGGLGGDSLWGQGGDDLFLVAGDSGSDTVNGGEGFDEIRGSDGNDIFRFANYTGDNRVERIDGGAGYNRIVSGVNQGRMDFSTTELVKIARIEGGAGSDQIRGSTGNDVIAGGAGNDYLAGGPGNDTYVLGRGDGADTVAENDTTAGNTDIAQFLTGITADQIWFKKNDHDLEVSIIGTSDKFVIKDWDRGNAYRVEQFKTIDGAKTLTDSNVQNLVNAMASFAPPAAGQTTLPQNYQDSLGSVIAANWQ